MALILCSSKVGNVELGESLIEDQEILPASAKIKHWGLSFGQSGS